MCQTFKIVAFQIEIKIVEITEVVDWLIWSDVCCQQLNNTKFHHKITSLIQFLKVFLSSVCTFKLHTFDILVCVSWWEQFSTKK